MSFRIQTLFLGALAMVGSGLLCASAGAADGQRDLQASFYLPGSHGYDLTFVASEVGDGFGSTLMAERGYALVDYSVRPDVLTRRRVDVDFGSLGRISVRFKPSAKQTGRCDVKDGTFTGEITFAADGGFTSVDEVSVEGQVGRPPIGGICIPGLTGRPSASPASLLARAKDYSDPGSIISCDQKGEYGYFAIQKFFSDHGTVHFAGAQDRIGKVEVRRYISAGGRTKSLRVSRDGRSARTRPPRPFTGTGLLRNGRLSGDLSVPLLGLSAPVELTPANGSAREFGRQCDKLFSIPPSGAETFTAAG